MNVLHGRRQSTKKIQLWGNHWPDECIHPSPHRAPDIILPTVAFARPVPNVIAACRITPIAVAADDRGLRRIEFFVDGRRAHVANFRGNNASGQRTGISQFAWDTSKEKPDIWHSLSAVAYDAAGNAAETRIAVRVVRGP